MKVPLRLLNSFSLPVPHVEPIDFDYWWLEDEDEVLQIEHELAYVDGLLEKIRWLTKYANRRLTFMMDKAGMPRGPRQSGSAAWPIHVGNRTELVLSAHIALPPTWNRKKVMRRRYRVL